VRLLLVEDNRVLADWLARTLGKQRYAIRCVENGVDADHVLRTEQFDLVLLDLALPKMSGHEVLHRLRERGDGTPVLVLTADNSTRSRVTELDHGADDYVAKPFEVEELEARIRVLLRRSAHAANTNLTCGDLVYSCGTREFTLAGKPLALAPREGTLLEALMFKAGTTVSKAALAQSLPSSEEGVSSDAIEIYIHRLRKKLEGSEATIVTLRGMGYLLRQVHRDA
jgi:two-component system response regulator TctD